MNGFYGHQMSKPGRHNISMPGIYAISGLLVGSVVENPLSNAGSMGSIPGLGRSPGEGNGNPLQYSCPENPMVRLAKAMVFPVVMYGCESWTVKKAEH